MKTNFKKNESDVVKNQDSNSDENQNRTYTQEEFQDYIVKSGAKGSFMIYRSDNEDEELGIEEI